MDGPRDVCAVSLRNDFMAESRRNVAYFEALLKVAEEARKACALPWNSAGRTLELEAALATLDDAITNYNGPPPTTNNESHTK